MVSVIGRWRWQARLGFGSFRRNWRSPPQSNCELVGALTSEWEAVVPAAADFRVWLVRDDVLQGHADQAAAAKGSVGPWFVLANGEMAVGNEDDDSVGTDG